MRILYFSRAYTTHDHRFLQLISKANNEVFFLQLENEGNKYEKRPIPGKVNILKWRADGKPINKLENLLELVPDLESIIKKIKPDIVHVGPVQSCGFMMALTGYHPFLLMSWGSDVLVDADISPAYNWITKYTLKQSDMVFCDCDAVRSKVKQFINDTNKKIIQLPWGIDLSVFKSGKDILEVRKRLDWDGKIIILSTRSWEKLYGIEVIIDAFEKVYNKNNLFRLLLLNDGSLKKSIEKSIVEKGLNGVIYRPGTTSNDELPNYYHAADIYVSSSESDGTSISLIEAMATGLQVIVSKIAGNEEWVTDGLNGWLVPCNDVSALSSTLIKASRVSAKKRTEMMNINKNIVNERANWSKNANKLLVAYDQLYKMHI